MHDASLEDDPELLEAVTAAAAIALENARLHAELRARLDELKGSRARIVEAGDSERRRLERNLHDGAQQRLVASRCSSGCCSTGSGDDPAAASSWRRRRATSSRSRSRSCASSPAACIRRCSSTGSTPRSTRSPPASPVPTIVDYEPAERLPEPVELAAYFVASEALANVAKYAGATP